MSQGCATLMPSAQHATAAKGTAFVGLCRVELLLVPPGHRGLSGAQSRQEAPSFSRQEPPVQTFTVRECCCNPKSSTGTYILYRSTVSLGKHERLEV